MTIESPPQLSIIVPVYRAAGTLEILHSRLVSALSQSENSFEIIFIEDCGGDSSWEVICALAARDKRVRGVSFSRNYGQHNALLCGVRMARGKICVTLDDDLQHPPEEIATLLAELRAGHDVVYGAPTQQPHGLLRGLASRITKMTLRRTMGVSAAEHVSAFRVFYTRIRRSFEDFRSPVVNMDVLLTWGSSKFSYVTVRHDVRHIGESGYTLRKLTNHAVNMLTGFSVFPLQLASLLGLCFGLFGMVILAYVVVRYLIEGSAVTGFPFLASLISILSGVQLLTLGIFGEYLARMHLRMMDQPAYSISETASSPTETHQNG